MASVLRDREGSVLTLTINRPDQRNALDSSVLAGLVEAFAEARDDEAVRVVVLTGAGDRAFCAGADLASGLMGSEGAVAAHDARGMLRTLFAAAADLDKPLVARVNGHALAGGLGVALLCDLAIAVDTATFGTPEVRVGLWPFVISRTIVDHLGPKRALELMLTGRRLTAAEALEWGLVNRVVAAAELDAAVFELTAELARGAPLAQRLGRRSFYEARDMGHAQAMAYLHGMLDVLVQTEDTREGLAAFLEKRDPQWNAR